jgi:hypothetical protein
MLQDNSAFDGSSRPFLTSRPFCLNDAMSSAARAWSYAVEVSQVVPATAMRHALSSCWALLGGSIRLLAPMRSTEI